MILNSYLCAKHKISAIHCRGYVTYMIVFFLKYLFKYPLIFDMRGFWVDERVEWNIWNKNNIKYKIFKRIEKILLKNADAIITLTSDAQLEIKKILNNKLQNKLFKTIPTCVDLSIYKDFNNYKISNKKTNTLIFCHLGAISTRYDLDRTLWFIKEINKFQKVN